MMRVWLIFPVAFILLLQGCQSRSPNTSGEVPFPKKAKWEEAIREFERQDRESRPIRGATIFVGSSSIRLWERLREDFKEIQVVNRGFGGSELGDTCAYFRELILPHHPRNVVVYAGANDIHNGKSPKEVLAAYRQLDSLMVRELPGARLFFISIAANPARWSEVKEVRAANRLIQQEMKGKPGRYFVDVHSKMLGPDGFPLPWIFSEDELHMNEQGYAIWRAALRAALGLEALSGK